MPHCRGAAHGAAVPAPHPRARQVPGSCHPVPQGDVADRAQGAGGSGGRRVRAALPSGRRSAARRSRWHAPARCGRSSPSGAAGRCRLVASPCRRVRDRAGAQLPMPAAPQGRPRVRGLQQGATGVRGVSRRYRVADVVAGSASMCLVAARIRPVPSEGTAAVGVIVGEAPGATQVGPGRARCGRRCRGL